MLISTVCSKPAADSLRPDAVAALSFKLTDDEIKLLEGTFHITLRNFDDSVKEYFHAENARFKLRRMAPRWSWSNGAPLELVEWELPQPGRGEVSVKVQACGVCHSDSAAKEDLFPSIHYPFTRSRLPLRCTEPSST
jgi:hypothetical protein